MNDSRRRSAVKALSWRLTGTVDTMIVSYFITGHTTLAVSIGCVEFFTKLGLFFCHERIWNAWDFGRTPLEHNRQRSVHMPHLNRLLEKGPPGKAGEPVGSCANVNRAA